jgi:hypothetical protein
MGILVEKTARYIPIKGHHNSLLRILAEPLPTIPTSSSEGTGRVIKTRIRLREGGLLDIPLTGRIHAIIIGIVLATGGLGGSTIHVKKIGFHIRLDISVNLGCSPLLLTDSGLGGKGGIAIAVGCLRYIATGSGRNANIVLNVTIIGTVSCPISSSRGSHLLLWIFNL